MNYLSRYNLPRVIFLAFCFFFVATTLVMAADVNDDAGIPNETIFTMMKKGGLVMIPLGIASIIALALAVERFISLKKE